jgi:hypothetical protein
MIVFWKCKRDFIIASYIWKAEMGEFMGETHKCKRGK